MGKIYLKVLGVSVIGLIGLWLLNQCYSAISSQSDAGVFLGYIGAITLGFAVTYLITLILKPSKSKQGEQQDMSKKTTIGLMVLLCLTALSTMGCGVTTIPPGKVGILVDQYGKNRGVQDYTTTTGRVWYNPWTTNVIEYPTYVQTVQWTHTLTEGNPVDESITFTTDKGTVVNADVSLSYQLDPGHVPAFYVKFRSDDLKTFTDNYLHNVTRDSMNEIGGHIAVEDVMGNNEKFLHDVRDRIQSQVGEIGVQLQQFGFIGAPRPPQGIIDAINNAQQAKQRALQAENELAVTKAEVAKQIAAAEGLAEANRRLAASITPQLLSKQQLDIQDRWIARWDGKMPTMTSGSSGGFLINIPTAQQH